MSRSYLKFYFVLFHSLVTRSCYLLWLARLFCCLFYIIHATFFSTSHSFSACKNRHFWRERSKARDLLLVSFVHFYISLLLRRDSVTELTYLKKQLAVKMAYEKVFGSGSLAVGIRTASFDNMTLIKLILFSSAIRPSDYILKFTTASLFPFDYCLIR